MMGKGHHPQAARVQPQLPAAGKPPALPLGPEEGTEIELLGETVIVKTSQTIAGQHEHAAIVTRVHDDGAVNVMLLPAIGESYPVEHVAREAPGADARMSWRHRR